MNLEISARSLSVPLKQSFKHNTAERKVTETVFVQIKNGLLRGYGESCPRTYVTGENVDGALSWIESKIPELATLGSLDYLKSWQKAHKEEIDKNLAAWAACEIALLDYFANEKNVSIDKLLGLNEISGSFQYTAVVSDENGEKLAKTLGLYLQLGFKDYKFKLSGDYELDKKKFSTLFELAADKKDTLRVRIDANNIWPGKVDEAIRYIQSLEVNFFGIEEPLGPHDFSGLSKLSLALNNTPIILDESLLRIEDIITAHQYPGVWMPNIRVSKVGGIQRALDIAQKTKELGCKAIVGAQVGETSILSRAALTVVNAYRDIVMAQEGAYGTLLVEKDVAVPDLRFGPAGLLTWATPLTSGLGLNISEENIAAIQ